MIFQEIDKYLQVDHVFSIDEGACRLTGKYCELEEAIKIAQKIKLAIRNNVGDYIGCSIGIASNRYLAKIATNFQKVDGLVVIKPTDLPYKLYSLTLTALPGIGQKTYSHLLKNKISTIQELCAEDKVSLAKKWGSINGEKIWSLIRGVDLPLEVVKKSTIGHSQVLGQGKCIKLKYINH
jgi:DNA polymerase IV